MGKHYDQRETADPQLREQALLERLPKAVALAAQRAPAIAAQLQGVEPTALRSRADLTHIPVIRKSELLQAQLEAREGAKQRGRIKAEDVFAGFATLGWGQAKRVFASPGPMYEPESARADYWGFARALYAAGVRENELVYNCFSYHFTPAGSMMETAAHAIGCTVFPGGIGQTEQQVTAMQDLAPTAYTGTPSFLKIILEKAQTMGTRLPSLTKALFSGEAFTPSMQAWFLEHGVSGFQAYGSADLGMIAYETVARDGLVLNEDMIVEIVRPGTNLPVPDGEVGEVVVTTLNPDYPLLRFGTGDLSAVLPGLSTCGRTNTRIRGWLGRADQTTKIRGMFVHPAQVAQILVRHPEFSRARVLVQGKLGEDKMILQLEGQRHTEALEAAVLNSVREVTKLRAELEFVAVGSLPNDGKVIEDQRDYG